MAPKFLHKRKNRLWLTTVILLVCVIVSIILSLSEPTAVNSFYEGVFNPRVSKILAVITPIAIAVVIGFFINILSNDVHETVKEPEKIEERNPAELPVQRIEFHYPEPKPEQTPPVSNYSPNQKFYPAPFLPDLKFFVGRKELLKTIKQTLAAGHRAAIHDISGLGKTFTSYKFVEENQANYDKIFFIRATKEEMLESLAKCGEMVNPGLAETTEQKLKADGFKQWLEENNKWLVVYDNVDEPATLRPFVPVSRNGDCLFTSNFRDVSNLGTDVSIAKLDKTDAEILLYSRAHNRPHSVPQINDKTERKVFDAIIEEIDGLPLTLNSAGAFIGRNELAFAEFRKIYEDTVWNTEDEFDPYENRKQSRSAGKVFSLVYDELCKNEKTGIAVRILLNSMCFIAPDEIPAELLLEILKRHYEPFGELENADAFWIEVRMGLTAYDLLKYDPQKQVFNTHRAIQMVIQGRNKERARETCRGLSEILIDLFPVYDFSNRDICEKYYQHIVTLLENSEKLRVDSEEINNLYYRLGRYQELLGNFSTAEKFYVRVTEISAAVFGTESANHATALNNLAGVYQLQGRYDEAIEKYREALRIGEHTIGKEHRAYAVRLNNLAIVYKMQGRYDEAIEKYEEALRIGEKTTGKNHPDYAIRLNNLANVYLSQSRFNEALEIYEEALSIAEQTVGKKHVSYATRLNNLALAYQSLGRYEEAIEKYEEALQIDEETIGKEHPDYAIAVNNLAGVYQSQGSYDKAIEKYEEAMRIDEKALGKGHPAYATDLNNLAIVFEIRGDAKQAINYYRNALKILNKTVPENHPYIASLKESIERCRKKTENN